MGFNPFGQRIGFGLVGTGAGQPALHILVRFQSQVNGFLAAGSFGQFGQAVDGKAVGVISARDILRYLSNKMAESA